MSGSSLEALQKVDDLDFDFHLVLVFLVQKKIDLRELHRSTRHHQLFACQPEEIRLIFLTVLLRLY